MLGLRLAGGWILAVFLIVMMLWIADLHWFPSEPDRNIVFPALARSTDLALWEPTGRFLVGALHVLAAILLLAPFTRRAGAALALAIALGAICAHVLWLGVKLPAADGGGTDGGTFFYLALSLAVASVMVLVVHPGGRPPRPGSGG